MKNILAQLTIFLSISSFAQYNDFGKVYPSHFSDRSSILLVVNVPGGGGGNGPYKGMTDKLINQIEEHKEEIIEKAKLLAEKMGYDYDSLEVTIAVPIEKEADPFLAHPYAGYWNKKTLTKEEAVFLEKTADAFSGVKPFYNETHAQFLDGEFYIIHPGGGGGNGPYKGIVAQEEWGQENMLIGKKIRSHSNTFKLAPFSIGGISSFDEDIAKDWKIKGALEGDIDSIERGEMIIGVMNRAFQITEEQMEAVKQYGVVNAFSADHNWDYAEREADTDVTIRFVIKESPNITAFGSSLPNGRIDLGVGIKTYDFGSSYDIIDPSLEKGIYAAESIGGGGGLGGSNAFHVIRIR